VEATGEPAFAALVVETAAVVSPRKTRTAQRSPDRIELVVAGVTVRVAADVDEAQLTRVIRAVRAASA
jgi:transposase